MLQEHFYVFNVFTAQSNGGNHPLPVDFDNFPYPGEGDMYLDLVKQFDRFIVSGGKGWGGGNHDLTAFISPKLIVWKPLVMDWIPKQIWYNLVRVVTSGVLFMSYEFNVRLTFDLWQYGEKCRYNLKSFSFFQITLGF